MKKRLIVALAIVLCLVFMVGCTTPGSETTTSAATSQTASAETASADTSTGTTPVETGNVYIDQLMAPAGTPASTDTSDIVIGVIQDLSGPGSVFGNSCLNGSTLAVEQINAAGGLNGRQIKLVSYDIKGDTAEAINAYTRLAEVDGAVAIAGPR